MTNDETGVAAVVLIVAPQGIPLVRDPSKPRPLFWKLPGGHGEEGEDAHMCAVREIEEETGIVLNGAQIKKIDAIKRSTHTLTAFLANIPSLSGLRRRGNEGEEVKVFTPQEILSMKDFMPNHYSVVSQILMNLVMQHA